MFETAELGQRLSKRVYKHSERQLRQDLLSLQQELLKLDHSQVIVVFAGVDGAGKGAAVNTFNEWMDPRWLVTRVFDAPVSVELERPEFWRYWQALPPRGRIGFFLSSWYSQPVLDAVYGHSDAAGLDRALDRIVSFESMLAADNAVILKFWMHLSHDAQKDRLENLQADPLTQARVSARDWENWRHFDRFVAAAEHTISRTNTGSAPWRIVEGTDPAYRMVSVATILRDTLRRRLDELQVQMRLAKQIAPGVEKAKRGDATKTDKNVADERTVPVKRARARGRKEASDAAPLGTPGILSKLNMRQSLPKAEYAERLSAAQAALHRLHLDARERGVSTILVFEGPDAAGKGGAIRRINTALDPRNYQVHGVAAPTDEERAQHYFWRFWRRLSRGGQITVFDRSWYGRVLVERVEGFASEEEWRRAYAEINDFETQLSDHGTVLLKFWLHISKGEQLRRFKAREKTPYKAWKLTEEDWRNRERWDDYVQAVNDMVQFTSTRQAPWILVEGNDKRFARIKILEAFVERLRVELSDSTPEAVSAPAIVDTHKKTAPCGGG